MLKNPSKKFLDPDPEVDYVQNLTMQFFLVHRHICSKIFRRSFYVELITDRQTDRQTDKQTNAGHYITFLAEVSNEFTTRNNVKSTLCHFVFTITVGHNLQFITSQTNSVSASACASNANDQSQDAAIFVYLKHPYTDYQMNMNTCTCRHWYSTLYAPKKLSFEVRAYI